MTTRDRFLLLFLPGVVLALGYAAFFLGGKNRALAKLEAAATSARARAVQPQVVQGKQVQLARTQKELSQLVALNKELTQTWQALVKPCQIHERRADRLTRLIDLLHKRGLEVTFHHKADGRQENELSMSEAQKKMEKDIETKDKQKPQLWRVQVVGRFQDLTETLHEIGRYDTFAIPLGISMKQVEGSAYHSWDLLLWI